MGGHKALDVYLNDHLAGATAACELVERCQADHEGTPAGQFFAELAIEIHEDRKTLEDLMDRLGTTKSSLKQAITVLLEKFGRMKLGVDSAVDTKFSLFLALETLYVGAEGKLCLWRALQNVADYYDAIAGLDFTILIKRAESQKSRLERERLATAAVLAEPTPA